MIAHEVGRLLNTQKKSYWRLTAFSGDNYCNPNFRGAQLNSHGVGCTAHIVNNGVQTSADVLLIDIERVVNKIFQFFHMYTVTVEALNDFCSFVDIEYK